jgi:hemerythrin
MGAIEWNSDLETGVKLMDEQHIRLVEIYNELHDAMMIGKAHKQMNEILDSLISYTEKHFREEEEYMETAKYHELKHHQIEHQQLLDKVKVFQRKMTRDEERISKPVVKFLEFWLKNHILGTDMSFAEWESKSQESSEEPQTA